MRVECRCGVSSARRDALQEHIDAFIETYNENAEPFEWTKSKVHQRRVKGRRLSDLSFRVLELKACIARLAQSGGDGALPTVVDYLSSL